MSLGLGDGWFPAAYDSRREAYFVAKARDWFSDLKSFWIDGFSDCSSGSNLADCSYTLKGPGNSVYGRKMNPIPFPIVLRRQSCNTHVIGESNVSCLFYFSQVLDKFWQKSFRKLKVPMIITRNERECEKYNWRHLILKFYFYGFTVKTVCTWLGSWYRIIIDIIC